MDNENSARQAVSFQDAQATHYRGQFEKRRDAALVAERHHPPLHIVWLTDDRRRITVSTVAFNGGREINFAV